MAKNRTHEKAGKDQFIIGSNDIIAGSFHTKTQRTLTLITGFQKANSRNKRGIRPKDYVIPKTWQETWQDYWSYCKQIGI